MSDENQEPERLSWEWHAREAEQQWDELWPKEVQEAYSDLAAKLRQGARDAEFRERIEAAARDGDLPPRPKLSGEAQLYVSTLESDTLTRIQRVVKESMELVDRNTKLMQEVVALRKAKEVSDG